MKVGFQVDELSKLNVKTDSTLPLIVESQKRKHKNFCFLPSSLTYKNNYLYAKAREILFKNNKLPNYALGKEQHLRVDQFNYVFIRQDPPYNMEYLSSLHLLEQVKGSTRFINNPKGIRNAPEKISMLAHKKIIPPTIITRSKTEVESFLKKYGKSVIKPLYGNGGESIFLLNKNDANYNQIVERFIDNSNEPFIVQKFLSEIRNGDKRIIIIDGEPIAALRRIPRNNEIRSNIHVGGNCEKIQISKNDLRICNEIKQFLKNEDLFFVGIDIIGKYLTEINVTSPTCIQEIKKFHKIDISKIIWDQITKK
jgi:glutathione synthase